MAGLGKRGSPRHSQEKSLTEPKFDDNPDYELRWPPELFAAEVKLLAESGVERSMDSNWQTEVETLLLLAFESPAPRDDFKEILKAHAHAQETARTRARRAARALNPGYMPDEEPF